MFKRRLLIAIALTGVSLASPTLTWACAWGSATAHASPRANAVGPGAPHR